MEHKYKENIFTSIVKGDTKTDILFQDELVIAFRDVNPDQMFKQHILVLPKESICDLNDLVLNFKNLVGPFFDSVRKAAKELGMESYRLEVNNGSFIHVRHLHVHLKSN